MKIIESYYVKYVGSTAKLTKGVKESSIKHNFDLGETYEVLLIEENGKKKGKVRMADGTLDFFEYDAQAIDLQLLTIAKNGESIELEFMRCDYTAEMKRFETINRVASKGGVLDFVV